MTCFSLKRLTSWWHSSRVVALLVLLKHQLKGKILRFFWSSTWPERNWNYFGSYHLIKVKKNIFLICMYFHFFIWYFLFDCFLFHNLPYQVTATLSNNWKIIQYVHILFDWGVLCVSKRDHYRIFIFLYLSLKTYCTESDVKKWLIVLSYPLLWKLFLCIFDNDKKIKNWEFSTQLHNSSHQSFCIWHLELSRTFFVMVKMQFFTHKRLDLLELI